MQSRKNKRGTVSAHIYLWLLILPGLSVLGYSLGDAFWGTFQGTYPADWLLLLGLTALGGIFPILIPASNRHQGIIVTFGDLFLFTAVLLFGPSIAVTVAFTEVILANLRVWSHIRNLTKAIFNVSQACLATWLAGEVFYYLADSPVPFDPQMAEDAIAAFLINLGLAALIFYILNSGSVVIAMALYSGSRVYRIWSKSFVWTSLSNAMGAVVAAIVILNMDESSFLLALVVILIGFVTYNAIRFYRTHIEKLIRSRQFLQSILDSISAYIAILDERGDIVAVNEVWESFAAQNSLVGPRGAVGENFPDLLKQVGGQERETTEEITQAIRRMVEEQIDTFQLEYSCGRRRHKHYFALQIHRFLDDGEVRVVVEFADITARKNLEEQLRHAQKMEAIGRLAGGVAHDFNNILTIISGYGTFLRDAVERDEKLKRHVETILEAADRAGAVTRQLLAFSRKQVMEPQVVSLNSMVGDTEKLLRRLIGEDIELVTIFDPAAGHIRVDPDQFAQVLINLAVNSRDAMPSGGQIRVETASVEIGEGDLPAAAGIVSGRYACLRVKDTGDGMDQDTVDHIFEPFYTTKEKGKGTGLGLSTVYGIIKQSGGHIEVSSEKGKGTVFEIYLPQVEVPAEKPEDASAKLEEPGRQEKPAPVSPSSAEPRGERKDAPPLGGLSPEASS